MQPNTKVVFAESPGSLTFEVQDLPALARAAHAHGAKLVVDNTWSGGYFMKPIELGADVSLQAATKYLVGHADALVGTLTSADEQTAQKIFYALLQLGSNVSADDAYLALRGMRTLSTRLERHQENASELVKWLKKRDEVERILHPAQKNNPGHNVWKRDFAGASGLFGVVLKPRSLPALKAFFNAFKLFGIGFSWGGYESLVLPVKPENYRTATAWKEDGPVIRFHAGLEDIEDLKIDLERAFMALAAAQK
jgi:cystathionine beta-lyase